MQMHENLVNELNDRTEGVSRTKPEVQRWQTYSVDEPDAEVE